MGGPGRKKTVSDEEILKTIKLHPDRVVTASEIADGVGMTGPGINNRLSELVDEGLVVKKQVGARAAVYWLTDAGKERAASQSS